MSLLVSACALVVLVLVLFNCVSCCKEREINFKVRTHTAQHSDFNVATVANSFQFFFYVGPNFCNGQCHKTTADCETDINAFALFPQEFEDNFEDEIDFTPPAEDTPSMQSPAEVYTLAVPPVAMPGPPHLDLPRIAGRSRSLHMHYLPCYA